MKAALASAVRWSVVSGAVVVWSVGVVWDVVVVVVVVGGGEVDILVLG